MARDADATLEACRAIHRYLVQQGRAEEAAAYRRRAEQRCDLLEEARAERARITARDPFVSHGLPAEEVERLRAQLARFPQLGAAYLVRKAVTHLPARPFYVLG